MPMEHENCPCMETCPLNRAMALIGRLEEVRRSLGFHVGAGHVAGWLCAGSFSF